MDLPSLIRDYGYAAVYVGGIFEGESVALLGGFAAKQRWLSLLGVIVSAQLGALTSDMFCFFCGRLFGDRLIARYPSLAVKTVRFNQLMERHQAKLLLTFQFMPGTCTVVPVAFGLSRISISRFLLLDLVGSTIWATSLSVIGYFFGAAAEPFLAKSQNLVVWIFLCTALLVFSLSYWRMKRAMRLPESGVKSDQDT